MTALRRLAAALAACSTFTTTLALPKASSDAPSSIVTPVVHAIKEKGTANSKYQELDNVRSTSDG